MSRMACLDQGRKRLCGWTETLGNVIFNNDMLSRMVADFAAYSLRRVEVRHQAHALLL
jgi:hypothetical protein